ncbi:MAG: orotidine-5'-phosphate decarboxylase [Planctomycetota bacterium]|nr:orotidine-5'-phosphate decarboxylase [Planctomycetota bacterium]MDA1262268.1 orotidine-5'-phosphate decarboxylase [Planctomycetota bacterium]
MKKIHPSDQLLDAIDLIGSPVCVGLDPVLEKLPTPLRTLSPIAAISAFSIGVVKALKGIVPCVKLQSACYERYGPDGMRVLAETMAAARETGLVTILDSKRGDIGISAEHYSSAMYGEYGADWSTVNAYLGMDGITPFLARGGAFALVRTSNPGSDALQSIQTVHGFSIAETVAKMVAETGQTHIGVRGFSSLGAVVGATKAREAASLRSLMPQQIFLVPGFGAQGGTVEDVRPCFHNDGRGAIVTASRSVLYATGDNPTDWISPIQRAAESFSSEIRTGILGSGNNRKASSSTDRR